MEYTRKDLEKKYGNIDGVKYYTIDIINKALDNIDHKYKKEKFLENGDLIPSFTWHLTKEGEDFWVDVYKKYQETYKLNLFTFIPEEKELIVRNFCKEFNCVTPTQQKGDYYIYDKGRLFSVPLFIFEESDYELYNVDSLKSNIIKSSKKSKKDETTNPNLEKRRRDHTTNGSSNSVFQFHSDNECLPYLNSAARKLYY